MTVGSKPHADVDDAGTATMSSARISVITDAVVGPPAVWPRASTLFLIYR
jgi:hypothetical protein